jgi:hypothetical protein
MVILLLLVVLLMPAASSFVAWILSCPWGLDATTMVGSLGFVSWILGCSAVGVGAPRVVVLGGAVDDGALEDAVHQDADVIGLLMVLMMLLLMLLLMMLMMLLLMLLLLVLRARSCRRLAARSPSRIRSIVASSLRLLRVGRVLREGARRACFQRGGTGLGGCYRNCR